jgi:outer membrane lipoprotein-sorting protein
MMTSIVSALTLLSAGAADPDVSDIVQTGFKDASFDLKVVQANFAELRKIDDDFGNQYRFKSVKISLKEPLMLRMETRTDDTSIVYIVNGFRRLSKIPRAGINYKEDLRDAPGKVQTPMDFGIITPTVVNTLFDAKFVRTDRATGQYVFDLTYKRPKYTDTSRHRIWFDPQKKYTVKREVYNQRGRQLSTFYYESPELHGGVWLPTKASVRNTDNKVAGVTEVVSVKVNSGLADSLFRI